MSTPESTTPTPDTKTFFENIPAPPRCTWEAAQRAIGSMMLVAPEYGLSGMWDDADHTSALFDCFSCKEINVLQLVPWENGDIKRRCFAAPPCKAREIDKAALALFNMKMKGESRRKPLKGQAEPLYQQASSNGHEPQRSEGYRIAHWYAERVGGTLRYVPRTVAWWVYEDKRWIAIAGDDPRLIHSIANDRFLLAHELLQQGHGELAQALGDPRWFREQRSSKNSDLWAGLCEAFKGEEPSPEPYLLGTPDCIVDLRTLETFPHHPKYNIRSLTGGRFRPASWEEHNAVLAARFGHVFEPHVLDAYLGLIGLALSGNAQAHRALVMVKGEEGSGKGGAVNSMSAALGARARGVEVAWFGGYPRGDIDSTGADILETQPAVLCIDEFSADAKVRIQRVLDLLGNKAEYRARHPYGRALAGRLRAQAWTTAVQVPQLKVGTGIDRRLAVLPTIGKLPPDKKNEAGGYTQELMDAILTMAVMHSPDVWKSGYEAPEGDTETKQTVLATMDPFIDWLDTALSDEYHGAPVLDVYNLARTEVDWPNEDEKSDTAMGSAISRSQRWRKDSRPSRGTDGQRARRIWLKADAGPLSQGENYA